MTRQRFVNTHSYDFMPFFALTCWTYIFLVSAIQPPSSVATFVLCIGAVVIAILPPWLDYQHRSPYQKDAALFSLQACEEARPSATPGIHASDSKDSSREGARLLQSQNNGDSRTPRGEDSVAGEHVPSTPSDLTDTLAAVHEKLLRIRQRNQETINRLAETQTLFDEHREKTGLMKAELAKTREKMLLSPSRTSSLPQQLLRPTGHGLGDLWGTGEV